MFSLTCACKPAFMSALIKQHLVSLNSIWYRLSRAVKLTRHTEHRWAFFLRNIHIHRSSISCFEFCYEFQVANEMNQSALVIDEIKMLGLTLWYRINNFFPFAKWNGFAKTCLFRCRNSKECKSDKLQTRLQAFSLLI